MLFDKQEREALGTTKARYCMCFNCHAFDEETFIICSIETGNNPERHFAGDATAPVANGLSLFVLPIAAALADPRLTFFGRPRS